MVIRLKTTLCALAISSYSKVETLFLMTAVKRDTSQYKAKKRILSQNNQHDRTSKANIMPSLHLPNDISWAFSSSPLWVASDDVVRVMPRGYAMDTRDLDVGYIRVVAYEHVPSVAYPLP